MIHCPLIDLKVVINDTKMWKFAVFSQMTRLQADSVINIEMYCLTQFNYNFIQVVGYVFPCLLACLDFPIPAIFEILWLVVFRC